MAESQPSAEVPDGAKSSYDHWVESEGVPVIKTFFVEDIRKVQLDWWERKGGNGAFLQMEGAGQINNCYICEIPPGKSLNVQRQLFEEMIYVIKGRGATTVWNDEDRNQTFEWQAGALFSPPLNTRHQLFNGSGDWPARYLALRAFGSKKYQGVGGKYQPSVDRKKGGSQIEYADEEPIVREWFNEGLAKSGVQSQMAKHYEQK